MTNSHGPDAQPGPRPASCGTRPTSSILWADPDDGRLPRVTSAVLRAARPLGCVPLSQRADLTRRCSPDSPAGAAPSASFRPPIAHHGAGITAPTKTQAAVPDETFAQVADERA